MKIVSMVPEAPTDDLNAYCTIAKIKLMHIPISRGSLLNAALSFSLVSVMQILLDCKGHTESIYMHCLDGRRVTSLVVLLIRRFQGWTPEAAFAEYWRYQTAMRPPVHSVFEMERVSRETVKFILDTAAMIRISREQEVPRWLGRLVTVTASPAEYLSIDPLFVIGSGNGGGGSNSGHSNSATQPQSQSQSGNVTPSSVIYNQKLQASQASTSGRPRTASGGAFPKRSLIGINGGGGVDGNGNNDDDDDDDDDRIIGMQRNLQISTSNSSLLSLKGSPQGSAFVQMRRSSSLDFLQGESEASEMLTDKGSSSSVDGIIYAPTALLGSSSSTFNSTKGMYVM